MGDAEVPNRLLRKNAASHIALQKTFTRHTPKWISEKTDAAVIISNDYTVVILEVP